VRRELTVLVGPEIVFEDNLVAGDEIVVLIGLEILQSDETKDGKKREYRHGV
jgi:hypothetical protein